MKCPSPILRVIAISVCLWSVPARAAVKYWHLGAQIGADSTDWNDPDNWGESGTNSPGVPGSADHVILHSFDPLTDSLITGSAAPQVNILTPSWHDGITSTLNIGPGGSINTNGAGNGFARLSGGDNATSTVNFLAGAGVSVWNILQMSFNNAAGGMPVVGTESDSFINLDGGILHLGSLGFSKNGLNATNIDLGKDGTLLVNGDHTDLDTGNATTWINNGYLTALDGTSGLDVEYDGPNGRTIFAVQQAPPGTTPANAELLNFVWRLRRRCPGPTSTVEFCMYLSCKDLQPRATPPDNRAKIGFERRIRGDLGICRTDRGLFDLSVLGKSASAGSQIHRRA